MKHLRSCEVLCGGTCSVLLHVHQGDRMLLQGPFFCCTVPLRSAEGGRGGGGGGGHAVHLWMRMSPLPCASPWSKRHRASKRRVPAEASCQHSHAVHLCHMFAADQGIQMRIADQSPPLFLLYVAQSLPKIINLVIQRQTCLQSTQRGSTEQGATRPHLHISRHVPCTGCKGGGGSWRRHCERCVRRSPGPTDVLRGIVRA